MSSVSRFYDDLAPDHHLIFDDWETSLAWQGRVLTNIIQSQWPAHNTVLDVSCGIGTQGGIECDVISLR